MAKPTRVYMLWNDLLHSSTATQPASCSDTNPLYPCSNMLLPSINRITRTKTDTGTKTWLFDLGSNKYIDTFAVAGHNLYIGGSKTFQLGRGTSSSPSMSTITASVTDTHFIYTWASPEEDRYVKFTTAIDTPKGYHQLGTVYVGLRMQLPYNPQIPIRLINEEENTIHETSGGQRWIYKESKNKGYSMTFIEDFTPEAFSSLETMHYDRGFTKPYFLHLSPMDSTEDPIFVHTKSFDFRIDSKDKRPGTWEVEEEL